jgi:hypothetical protein
MKRLSVAFLLPLLFAASSVSAATFYSADSAVLAVPVSGDLYVSGQNVNIHKDVSGDLFIAGGKVDVQNSVTQGLNVAGGNVQIASNVGDDVRVAGGEVTIRGRIAGDLLVFGGTVTVGSDAVVMGDTYVNGGTVTFRGVAGRDLHLNGGNLSLEGITHGNLDAKAGHLVISSPVEGNAKIVADTLTIAQGASFKGSVDYWTSSASVDFGSSLSQGQQAVFHPEFQRFARKAEAGAAGAFAALIAAITIYKLLSAAVIILLLVLLTKTFFLDVGKELKRRPVRSFVTGLCYFILVPIVAFLLFITIIGLPLGLLAVAAYVFTLLFAAPLTSVVLAYWLAVYTKRDWGRWSFIGVSIGLFIVLKLVGIVPVLGWLVKAVAILFAIGALLTVKMNKVKKIL